jgi:hypothetical protein
MNKDKIAGFMLGLSVGFGIGILMRLPDDATPRLSQGKPVEVDPPKPPVIQWRPQVANDRQLEIHRGKS